MHTQTAVNAVDIATTVCVRTLSYIFSVPYYYNSLLIFI